MAFNQGGSLQAGFLLADFLSRGAGSRRVLHGGAGDHRHVHRGGAGDHRRVRHGADRDLDRDQDLGQDQDLDREVLAAQAAQAAQVVRLREDRGLAEGN